MCVCVSGSDKVLLTQTDSPTRECQHVQIACPNPLSLRTRTFKGVVINPRSWGAQKGYVLPRGEKLLRRGIHSQTDMKMCPSKAASKRVSANCLPKPHSLLPLVLHVVRRPWIAARRCPFFLIIIRDATIKWQPPPPPASPLSLAQAFSSNRRDPHVRVSSIHTTLASQATFAPPLVAVPSVATLSTRGKLMFFKT